MIQLINLMKKLACSNTANRMLVVMIFLTMSVLQIWASQPSYGKLIAKSDPSGSGLIYLSTSQVESPQYVESEEPSLNVTTWMAEDGSSWFMEATVYCYANEEREGYLWAGWYDNSQNLLQNGDAFIKHSFTPKEPRNGRNQQYTEENLTAKWVQPKVTGVLPNPIEFIVVDPTATIESKTATFTVVDCSKNEHFELIVDNVGTNFSIEDNTFTLVPNDAPDIFNGTATITVGYTPTGEHGTHGGGYAILKSALYEGDFPNDNDNSNYQKVYFQANENYTPIFTALHNTDENALVLGTTTYGLQQGPPLQSNAGDLCPAEDSRNYAAKAPIWESGNRNNATVWKAEIVEESGYEGLFTFVGNTGETDDPQIIFTPIKEIVEKKGFTGEGSQNVFTARVKITCTYYDQVSNSIKSDDYYSYVKATVEQSDKEELAFVYDPEADGNYKYTYAFEDVEMGRTPYFAIPFRRINVNDVVFNVSVTDGNNVFTEPVISGDNVIIYVKDDVTSCGEHSITISASGTGAIKGEPISTSQSFDVSANMVLAKPVVTAIGSNGKVSFTWSPIQGASSYEVYNTDNTLLSTKEAGESLQYEVSGLKTDVSFSIYVKAKSSGECNDSKSDVATGTSNVKTITIANASADKLNMETGMDEANDDERVTYPYSTVRKIDVSAAFDKDGKVLFDRMYIFEKTKKVNGTWTTPYYIYEKTDDYTYTNVGEDAYYMSINDTKKDGNIGKVIDVKDGSKLYFTGYCPFGTTGNEEDNAVLHFVGGASQVLDLYFDSLQIYARAKKTETVTPGTDDLAVNYYTQGSGSAIAIESSSNSSAAPFQVNIHIRGKNTLDAALGTTYKIENSSVSISDNPKHYSSPICVLPTGNNQVTKLTFDDIWPGSTDHTNGVLKLQEKDADNASNISIDLGNAYTEIEFNGGNYYFQDIAAAYKTTFYSGSKSTMSGTVTVNIDVYGVVSSDENQTKYPTTTQVGKSMTIKDGTYNAKGTNGIAFYTQNLYINGGSFNSGNKESTDGKFKTPSNIGLAHYIAAGADPSYEFKDSYGNILSKYTVECTSTNQYWTTENVLGTDDVNDDKAIITNFTTILDDLFPHAGVNDKTTGTSYHKSLSQYYVGGKQYGYNSLSPKNSKVHLMLPYLECNGVHLPWQVCAPAIEASHQLGTVSVGGDVNNLGGCPIHNKDNTVDRLLFMQLDGYGKDVLAKGRSLRDASVAGNRITLTYNGEDNYAVISDANNYTISQKVYMLMPIEAAKWILFTAPFHVANVYVIESYPENQLVTDFNGVRGKIKGENNIKAAREEQAGRIIDLYSFWYSHAKNVGVTPTDFFGSDPETDPYSDFVDEWITYESNSKINTDGDYTPVIEKLIHYTGDKGSYPDGKTWKDANYYLYKASDPWEFKGTNFNPAWSEVSNVVDGTDPIMECGHVYAMQFPYNTIGGVHDPASTWDYWTGKYLLIESTDGPHTISGSTSPAIASLSNNTAQLFGNASFADVAVSAPDGTSLWSLVKQDVGEEGNDTQRDIHIFDEKETALMKPTEGFLLANFVARTGMRARTINYQTGEVTYEPIDNPDDDDDTSGSTTGVPTIMGDVSLVVVPTEQGLQIVPLAPQQVMLFSADGKLIFSEYLSEEKTLPLSSGVYVVRGERDQVKVLKK